MMRRALALAALLALVTSPARAGSWSKVATSGGPSSRLLGWWQADGRVGVVRPGGVLTVWDGTALSDPTDPSDFSGYGAFYDAANDQVFVVGIDAATSLKGRYCRAASPLAASPTWTCSETLALATMRGGGQFAYNPGSARTHLFARSDGSNVYLIGSTSLGGAPASVETIASAASQYLNTEASAVRVGAEHFAVFAAKRNGTSSGAIAKGYDSDSQLYAVQTFTDAALSGTTNNLDGVWPWVDQDLACALAGDGADSHVWCTDTGGAADVNQAFGSVILRPGAVANLDGTPSAYVISSTGTLYECETPGTSCFSSTGQTAVSFTSGNATGLTLNDDGTSLLAWSSSGEVWEWIPTGPTAAFSCTPTTGQAPLSITCTDSSTAGDAPIESWSWGGECGTSTSQNPTLVCPEGRPSVSLTVTTDVGSDIEAKPEYITVSGGTFANSWRRAPFTMAPGGG